MNLAQLSKGRDNNLNLIRIIAALAVLITHSFAIVTGQASSEPLRNSLGMSIGDISVDIFFIASGFLVSKSLFTRSLDHSITRSLDHSITRSLDHSITRSQLSHFFISRILRIYPALWVMLIITTFPIGIYFTDLSATSYLSSTETWLYFLKCSTLVAGVEFNLPGVFSHNLYPSAVNGSLWSMPFEIRMYLGLALTWLLISKIIGASKRNITIIAVGIFLFAAMMLIYKHHNNSTGKLAKLLFMFSCGSVFYVLRDAINIKNSTFIGLCILLFFALIIEGIFYYAYCFSIAYILFYLAYIPGGAIRKYNSLGDYSYGLYIYAFPIQQSLAALIPGISIFEMTLASSLIAFIMAAFSWHLIEHRAMSHRDFLLKRIRPAF